MARNYSSPGSGAVGSNKTLVTLVSATTIRPQIHDLVIGCAATPADQATKFQLQRFTGAGTPASNPTPEPLDPGDPAALATTGTGIFAGEPTYTATKVMQTISLNQRATFRWVAAPGCEYKCPATAANGLGLQSVTATGAATHDANITWAE